MFSAYLIQEINPLQNKYMLLNSTVRNKVNKGIKNKIKYRAFDNMMP